MIIEFRLPDRVQAIDVPEIELEGRPIVSFRVCKLGWCQGQRVFIPKREDHDYCSEECRREDWNKARGGL